MQLSCKSNKRLSIYSAQYGRTVNGQAMHCSTTHDQPVSKGKTCILLLKKDLRYVFESRFVIFT